MAAKLGSLQFYATNFWLQMLQGYLLWVVVFGSLQPFSWWIYWVLSSVSLLLGFLCMHCRYWQVGLVGFKVVVWRLSLRLLLPKSGGSVIGQPSWW